MKMKTVLFLVVICLAAKVLTAQDVSVSLGVDVSKSWTISKPLSVRAAQRFQFNPEIDKLDNPNHSPFFNELGLFPSDNDDDNDDDDDDDNLPGNGFTNADAFSLVMEKRSATEVGVRYKLLPSLRLNQEYALLIGEGPVRHLLSTELSHVPKWKHKKWRIDQQLAFQLLNRMRRDGREFQNNLSFKSGVSWAFKKRHALYTDVGINGAFDEKRWEWDRTRISAGIEYELSKRQSFDFGYRFQMRLNTKRTTSQGVSLRYRLAF